MTAERTSLLHGTLDLLGVEARRHRDDRGASGNMTPTRIIDVLCHLLHSVTHRREVESDLDGRVLMVGGSDPRDHTRWRNSDGIWRFRE